MKLHLIAALTAVIVVLAAGAESLGWPSLPGVPSVPSASQAAKGIVSNELLHEFGNWFNLNRPVYVSGNDVLPTVKNLPGGAFRPASLAATQKLFVASPNGVIRMPVGDYNVAVVTYCMGHYNQGPWRNKFLLSPIKGVWSDIVAALNYRAYGSRFTAPQVQVLSWSLQAGMDYQELTPGTKAVVDGLLPDFKARLSQDFYEQARDEWNSLTAHVPNAPSFDSALGQLGDAGKAITAMRQARDTIIADGNDFNGMVASFARLGQGRAPNPIANTPWSVIAPGVYARLRTKGTLLTQGVVQIRITAQAASNRFDVASTNLQGIGTKRVAFDWSFPFTNFAGFFNGPTQPLSWTPEPGDAPDPNQSGGGPDGGGQPPNWIFYGTSWKCPACGGDSGNNGNNQNNQNNQNNDDSGGGGGGGNGSNPNPNNNDENNGNDFDTSTPCDPPGNVFGIPKGTVASSGGNTLVVSAGKDKAGHVVCLLLRPFVDMAALGWPDRGVGTVDDGSVGYDLPGQSGPGHLVVIAHYTYGTSSSLIQPLIKHQVTAVIEYNSVSGPCPELSQTLQLHTVIQLNNPMPPGWLSGAELENRMCIAGVLGGSMNVQTWVVDGTAVNQLDLNHPVDPQNFLYEDAWNHM